RGARDGPVDLHETDFVGRRAGGEVVDFGDSWVGLFVAFGVESSHRVPVECCWHGLSSAPKLRRPAHSRPINPSSYRCQTSTQGERLAQEMTSQERSCDKS